MLKQFRRDFGYLRNGSKACLFELRDENGFGFSVTNYGAALVSLIVPDKNNQPVDVLLGFDSVSGYESHDGYAGAICGRMANRIKDATFQLNGKQYQLAQNNGSNHLHGGLSGFDKKIWDVTKIQDGFRSTLLSEHMEEGYPGELEVILTYKWLKEVGLEISYAYSAKADTICNLTNHAYFNLNGQKGSALDQVLRVCADYYTPTTDDCIPTGEIRKVEGSFNLNEGKLLRDILISDDTDLLMLGGLDHNFVLRKKEPGELSRASSLTGLNSGIQMSVLTTMPGLQVYTGNYIAGWEGKNGVTYQKHDGIALETQFFPNAPNLSHFPSPVLRAGQSRMTKTTLLFD